MTGLCTLTVLAFLSFWAGEIVADFMGYERLARVFDITTCVLLAAGGVLVLIGVAGTPRGLGVLWVAGGIAGLLRNDRRRRRKTLAARLGEKSRARRAELVRAMRETAQPHPVTQGGAP